MDENADVRLTIETARKNKNWTRRCYAYELALEYFAMSDPDCYEMRSYCDLISEFLEEKTEYCLVKALCAVRVYVNRCLDALSIAKALTRTIIQKIFSSRSKRVLELASDIIMEFVEWEAQNVVLEELIAGALKCDIRTADLCIQVICFALKDFGPQVININRLIDLVQSLVRSGRFHDVQEGCSSLMILMYRWTGPQIRVHFTPILDYEDLLVVEDGYEEVKDIPVFNTKFVRYTKEHSLTSSESEEKFFATCKIAKQGSPEQLESPKYPDREVLSDREDSLLFDVEELRNVEDFEWELNNAMALSGVLENQNKNDDSESEEYLQEDVARSHVNVGVGSGGDNSDNNEGTWNNGNLITYDHKDGANHNLLYSNDDYISKLFSETDDILDFFEDFDLGIPSSSTPKEQFEPSCQPVLKLQDRPVNMKKTIGKEWIYGKTKSPYETILGKLFDVFGTEDTLHWICEKFNHKSQKQKPEETYSPCKVKLVAAEIAKREWSQNEVKRSLSETSTYDLSRRCAMCLYNFSDRIIFNYRQDIKDALPSWTGEEINKVDCGTVEEPKELKKGRFYNMKKSMDKNERPCESDITAKEHLHQKDIKDPNVSLSTPANLISQINYRKGSWSSQLFKIFRLRSTRDEPKINQRHKKRRSWNLFSIFRYRKRKSDFKDQRIKEKSGDSQTNLIAHKQNVSNNKDIKLIKDDAGGTNSTNDTRMSYPWQQTFERNRLSHVSHRNPIRLLPKQRFVQTMDLPGSSGSPDTAKEVASKVTICLSEGDSITQVSPNLCCYYFQKNSLRRLMSKSCEADLQNAPEGGFTSAGSSQLRASLRNERLNLKPNRSCDGELRGSPGRTDRSWCLHHRGSGDELCFDLQQNSSQAADDSRSCSIRKGHKLFCCLSMDGGDDACRF